MQRVRITKTLVDSWLRISKSNDGYEAFLKTLRREKTPPTTAMLDGIRFENVLNNTLDGVPIEPDHEWYNPITEMAAELDGSVQQVNLYANTTVDGVPFLLHGVLDYLREGHIWDCKYSKRYELNKYYWEHTSQTAMYLALVPEAFDFTYIISDGKYVYRERYPRDIVPPIEITIKNFMIFLDRMKLVDIYIENWRAK